MKRVLSIENFLRVGIGIFKFALLVTIAGIVLYQDLPVLLQLPQYELSAGSQLAYEYGLRLIIKLAVALAVVGMADYGIRWLLQRRKLRMSDQDLREEQRNEQAAQQVAARQRADT